MIPSAHPLQNGLVVIFEGIDGVGKTTQLELVQAELEKAGWPVMVTRNMGGTPIGEALRKVIKSPLERPPLTDLYISLAVQEPLLAVIDDARKQGKVVLMDRGPLSLAAYQIYGSGIDESLGWQHVGAAMDRIKPDAVLLYDMDAEQALARIKDKAGDDYFESKPVEYFRKVADGFRTAASRYPAATTLDASLSIDEIRRLTIQALDKALEEAD